jgi:hypothetical protein
MAVVSELDLSGLVLITAVAFAAPLVLGLAPAFRLPVDRCDSGARAPARHGAIRTSSELMNQRKSDVEWIDTSFA